MVRSGPHGPAGTALLLLHVFLLTKKPRCCCCFINELMTLTFHLLLVQGCARAAARGGISLPASISLRFFFFLKKKGWISAAAAASWEINWCFHNERMRSGRREKNPGGEGEKEERWRTCVCVWLIITTLNYINAVNELLLLLLRPTISLLQIPP